MRIIWSEFAEIQLDNIFNYYYYTVSYETASRIVIKIILAVDILLTNPLIGQIEELLLNRKTQYRYLVQDNYKIIYSVNNDEIRIADIFDVRQSPKKIKRKK